MIKKLMKFREIKIRLLLISGICYRLFITGIEILFLRLLTGDWALAIKGSILWNILNVGLYYIYHYFFAKMFKIGR